MNAPNSWAISQIFTMQKIGMGYAKVIHEKNKRNKRIEKNTSVWMNKTMGTSMPAWKKGRKREKDE
jgi:hypothetical protein